MILHILVTLYFGNFDDNVVICLCRCVLSYYIVMIVLAPWLAPKGTICLQYVGNEADCR